MCDSHDAIYLTHASMTGGVNHTVAAKLGAQYEQFIKRNANGF